MQFEVQKSILLKAISDCIGAVERRNTIPILQNIKIDVENDKVILSATDMDILISSTFDCDMKNSGKTTVPAQTFFDVIKKIPDGSVLIKLDDKLNLQIKSGKSKYNLPCIDIGEFPVISESDMVSQFEIDSEVISKMIDKTRFAISNDETRYYLNGLFLQLVEKEKNNYEVRTIATDGHRLALSFNPIEKIEPFSVIIPRKTINEIRRVIDGVKKVTIFLSKVKIKVIADKTTIISKVIDGEFPDYEKVLPKLNQNLALVKRKIFYDCIDRVAIVASDKHKAVKLTVESGKMLLQVGSDENYLALEEFDVNYSGEKIETGFNSKYLLDIIAHIDKEELMIRFKDGMSPALIEAQDMSSVFVIMPVRV
jgi:DNA polymerase-3 subunit beta